MSRTFVSASSQKLEAAAAVATGYPITMCAWVNPVTVSASQTAVSVGHGTNASQYFALAILSTAKVFFESANSTTNDCTGATSVTANVWSHIAVIAASTASQNVYLNGASDGTSATGKTPTGFNRTNIGSLNNGGVAASFFNGQIAHAAIWNVALSVDEMKLLAKGRSPLRIRPLSLINYCEVGGSSSPEPDQMNSNTFTVTGATQGSSNPGMFQGSQNFQFVNVPDGMSGSEKIR